jgi:hypothetical protein
MKEVNNQENAVTVVYKKNTACDIMSDDISNLADALSKAQAAIENVSKDRQGYSYKYADLASCLDAIRKPLTDNGFSLSQIISQDGDKMPVLITLLMHKSGQWLKSIFPIESVVMKQGNPLQHLGAGITYTRRYALSAMVGLTQEDDDAQSLTKKPEVPSTLTVSQKFISLCSEHKLPAKEFAEFCGVNSEKPETVKQGIDNFIALKERFEESSNADIR